MPTTKFGVAQPVRRVEDPRLLKGAGRYTDDIVLPGTLYRRGAAQPARGGENHRARHRAAKALPGVPASTPAPTSRPTASAACPAPSAEEPRRLAAGRAAASGAGATARCAMSAIRWRSSSPKRPKPARDAAEAIEVDYDILPSVTDLAARDGPGAAARSGPTSPHNVVFDWEIGDKAATEAEFARAAHVTRLTVVNNRIVVNSMEARAALAEYDAATGRWTLCTNTQGGWLVKDLIGAGVRNRSGQFRIITPDVGGGFGMKLFLYAEQVLTCYAARKLGRPVKWASRAQRGVPVRHAGPRQHHDRRTGDRQADGKFLALRTRNVANMGAYLSTFAPYHPDLAGTGVLASVYGFKAIYANVLGVFTNTVPVDAYRGAGRPESNYLVERLVDAAARELKIDRVELRRRNMVLPAAMPHTTPVGKNYDSGDFRIVLDAAAEDMDWAGFAGAPGGRRPSAASGAASGWPITWRRPAATPTERAEIRFADDGFVDVYVGTQSTGQGHETAYVQLTADNLGIDGDKMRIRQGDTDTIPVGRRHRRRAQPVFRRAGDPADRRTSVHREGQEGSGRGAGSRAGGYRLRRGALLHRRHRSRHRHHRRWRRRSGRRRPRASRRRSLDAAEIADDPGSHLPERLPHGRGRGRSGNRRGRTGALQRLPTMSARRSTR